MKKFAIAILILVSQFYAANAFSLADVKLSDFKKKEKLEKSHKHKKKKPSAPLAKTTMPPSNSEVLSEEKAVEINKPTSNSEVLSEEKAVEIEKKRPASSGRKP